MAYIPVQPSLTVAGRVFTDLGPSFKLLVCRTTAGADYAAAADLTTGAAYQVPSGKTFTVLAMEGANSNGSPYEWNLSYSTGAQTPNGTATPPTGAVYGSNLGAQLFVAPGTLGQSKQFAVSFVAPALTYLGVADGGAGSAGFVYLYGYEA